MKGFIHTNIFLVVVVTGVHEFPGTSYCGAGLWDEDQSLEIISPGCRHPAPNMGGETAPSVVTRVCWTWSTYTTTV